MLGHLHVLELEVRICDAALKRGVKERSRREESHGAHHLRQCQRENLLSPSGDH